VPRKIERDLKNKGALGKQGEKSWEKALSKKILPNTNQKRLAIEKKRAWKTGMAYGRGGNPKPGVL